MGQSARTGWPSARVPRLCETAGLIYTGNNVAARALSYASLSLGFLFELFLQGPVQGGRRRGRQRKQWENNMKEWTGLEWNILLRKAENREESRKLVVKSSVVPPTVSQTTGQIR